MPGRPQESPRGAQERPRGAQERPKTLPREAQEVPKRPPEVGSKIDLMFDPFFDELVLNFYSKNQSPKTDQMSTRVATAKKANINKTP